MSEELIEVDQEPRQLAALVGEKSGYYLDRWAPLIAGRSSRAGWNWAAFFLGSFWLPYRKMYKATFIFYGVSMAAVVIEAVSSGGLAETGQFVSSVISVTLAVLCGMYGNRWYLVHARAKVAEAVAEGHSGNDLLRVLSARGGTSLAASLGIFAGLCVIAMGVGLVLALLNY